MQSMARLRILSRIGYLSTVSGGGYIGTWLNLWSQRDPAGLKGIEEKLVPPPEGMDGGTQEAPQIQWLRKYSNFLAPITGIFSADTWLIFTIWARNTILNILVLTPFLASALLAPWAYLSYMVQPISFAGVVDPRILLASSMLVLIGAVVTYQRMRGKGLLRGVIPALMVCTASVLMAKTSMVELSLPGRSWPAIEWIAIGGAGVAGAFCCIGMWTKQKWNWPGFIVRTLVCSAVTAAAMTAVYLLSRAATLTHPGSMQVLIVMAPAISAACSLQLMLIIGVLGPLTRDEDREGLSRVTAWIGIVSSAGIVLNAIASYGPVLIAFLYQAGRLFYAAGGAWILISGIGAYLAQSGLTSGTGQGQKSWLERLLPVTSYVFVLGLLFLVSFGLHLMLSSLNNLSGLATAVTTPQPVTYCDSCRQEAAPIAWLPIWSLVAGGVEADVLALSHTQLPTMALLIALASFFVASRFLPINEFSMFSFYKNRLVRAYCGASRPGRDNESDFVAFTNLAACDDVPLRRGQTSTFTHLVNTAANISLEETGLAERRAVSFVFTPYGCGYRLPSSSGFYRKFANDGEPVTSGTAMTISGAAASPNMGFHTSPVLAFLMTVFNVRLGYWFWNPGKQASLTKYFYALLGRWQQTLERMFKKTTVDHWLASLRHKSSWLPEGPKWGTFYFISELFALANRHRKYLYLSDGGHFENLAVYELLARRVKYIICIDGEEDPNLKFEGLGSLVRKAQQDFGVRIRIDTSDIEERSENGWSRSHCTVGRIQYPNDAKPGYLVYIKLSVTGDEPQDILTYRKLNPLFPHQSTGDQFFNESQFESYRRLGYHVGNISFLRDTWKAKEALDLDEFFKALDNSWQPIPRGIRQHFTNSNEAWDGYIKELQETPALKKLAAQLSGSDAQPEITPEDMDYQACTMFCLRLIQFMENVFFDLQLSSTISHPAIRGWKAQYEIWFGSKLLREIYQRDRRIFSRTFTVFCDNRFKTQP